MPEYTDTERLDWLLDNPHMRVRPVPGRYAVRDWGNCVTPIVAEGKDGREAIDNAMALTDNKEQQNG